MVCKPVFPLVPRLKTQLSQPGCGWYWVDGVVVVVVSGGWFVCARAESGFLAVYFCCLVARVVPESWHSAFVSISMRHSQVQLDCRRRTARLY